MKPNLTISELMSHFEDYKTAPEGEEKSLNGLLYFIGIEIYKRDKGSKFNFPEADISREMISLELKNCEKYECPILMRISNCSADPSTWNSVFFNIEDHLDRIRVLNIPAVRRHITKTDDYSNLIQDQDLILFMGQTEAGKSTSIHFLAGDVFELNELKEPIIKIPANNEDLKNIKIGEDPLKSETKYITPVKVKFTDIGIDKQGSFILCDAPGIHDTRNAEIDISNSISFLRSIKKCRSILPVFLLNKKTYGIKCDNLQRILPTLAAYFKDFKKHEDSLEICFTNISQHEIDKYPPTIKEILRELNHRGRSDTDYAHMLDYLKRSIETNNYTSFDIIRDNPKDVILKLLSKQRKLIDPNQVFQSSISKESREVIKAQLNLHRELILSSLHSTKHSTDLIESKINDILFLNNDILPYDTSFSDLIREIVDHFERLNKEFDKIFEQETLNSRDSNVLIENLAILKNFEPIRLKHYKEQWLSYEFFTLKIERYGKRTFNKLLKLLPNEFFKSDDNPHWTDIKLETFISDYQFEINIEAISLVYRTLHLLSTSIDEQTFKFYLISKKILMNGIEVLKYYAQTCLDEDNLLQFEKTFMFFLQLPQITSLYLTSWNSFSEIERIVDLLKDYLKKFEDEIKLEVENEVVMEAEFLHTLLKLNKTYITLQGNSILISRVGLIIEKKREKVLIKLEKMDQEIRRRIRETSNMQEFDNIYLLIKVFLSDDIRVESSKDYYDLLNLIKTNFFKLMIKVDSALEKENPSELELLASEFNKIDTIEWLKNDSDFILSVKNEITEFIDQYLKKQISHLSTLPNHIDSLKHIDYLFCKMNLLKKHFPSIYSEIQPSPSSLEEYVEKRALTIIDKIIETESKPNLEKDYNFLEAVAQYIFFSKNKDLKILLNKIQDAFRKIEQNIQKVLEMFHKSIQKFELEVRVENLIANFDKIEFSIQDLSWKLSHFFQIISNNLDLLPENAKTVINSFELLRVNTEKFLANKLKAHQVNSPEYGAYYQFSKRLLFMDIFVNDPELKIYHKLLEQFEYQETEFAHLQFTELEETLKSRDFNGGKTIMTDLSNRNTQPYTDLFKKGIYLLKEKLDLIISNLDELYFTFENILDDSQAKKAIEYLDSYRNFLHEFKDFIDQDQINKLKNKVIKTIEKVTEKVRFSLKKLKLNFKNEDFKEFYNGLEKFDSNFNGDLCNLLKAYDESNIYDDLKNIKKINLDKYAQMKIYEFKNTPPLKIYHSLSQVKNNETTLGAISKLKKIIESKFEAELNLVKENSSLEKNEKILMNLQNLLEFIPEELKPDIIEKIEKKLKIVKETWEQSIQKIKTLIEARDFTTIRSLMDQDLNSDLILDIKSRLINNFSELESKFYEVLALNKPIDILSQLDSICIYREFWKDLIPDFNEKSIKAIKSWEALVIAKLNMIKKFTANLFTNLGEIKDVISHLHFCHNSLSTNVLKHKEIILSEELQKSINIHQNDLATKLEEFYSQILKLIQDENLLQVDKQLNHAICTEPLLNYFQCLDFLKNYSISAIIDALLSRIKLMVSYFSDMNLNDSGFSEEERSEYYSLIAKRLFQLSSIKNFTCIAQKLSDSNMKERCEELLNSKINTLISNSLKNFNRIDQKLKDFQELDIDQLNRDYLNLRSIQSYLSKVLTEKTSNNINSTFPVINDSTETVLKFAARFFEQETYDIVKCANVLINLSIFSNCRWAKKEVLFSKIDDYFAKAISYFRGVGKLKDELSKSPHGRIIIQENKAFEGIQRAMFNEFIFRKTIYELLMGEDYVDKDLLKHFLNGRKISNPYGTRVYSLKTEGFISFDRNLYLDLYEKYLAPKFITDYINLNFPNKKKETSLFEDLLDKNLCENQSRINYNSLLTEINNMVSGKNLDVEFLWTSEHTQVVPKLVTYIFAIYSLQNSKPFFDEKNMLNESERRKYLFYPHAGQIIAIFRMLGVGNESENNLPNNLIQLGTGEGKSVVLAVVASVLALFKVNVSVICYSAHLSSRDESNFKKLFIKLGVKYKISYENFKDASNDLVNQRGNVRRAISQLIESGITPRPNETKSTKICLVDEVDVFFKKSLYGKSYNPLVPINNPQISNVMDKVWETKDITFEKIETLPEYKELIQNFNFWKELIKIQIQLMIRHRKSVDSHEYEVLNDKIVYKSEDSYVHHTKIGYLTAFAAYKENQRKNLTTESLKGYKELYIEIGNFPYSKVILNFERFIGITGTAETLTVHEDRLLRDFFGIKTKSYVPLIYDKDNLKINEMIIIRSPEEHIQKIMNEIRLINRAQRPIVVFFKKKKDLKDFEKTIKESGLSYLTLTEDNLGPERIDIIRNAVKPFQITLATKAFGRGTDFDCVKDKIVHEAGGLHVIQTFISKKRSEEIQIMGRTARQGSVGSFRIIANTESLQKILMNSMKSEEFLQSFTTNREILREIMSLRVRLNEIKLQDRIKKDTSLEERYEKSIQLIDSLWRNDRNKLLEILINFNKDK